MYERCCSSPRIWWDRGRGGWWAGARGWRGWWLGQRRSESKGAYARESLDIDLHLSEFSEGCSAENTEVFLEVFLHRINLIISLFYNVGSLTKERVKSSESITCLTHKGYGVPMRRRGLFGGLKWEFICKYHSYRVIVLFFLGEYLILSYVSAILVYYSS
jgi:hypothetical protein